MTLEKTTFGPINQTMTSFKTISISNYGKYGKGNKTNTTK